MAPCSALLYCVEAGLVPCNPDLSYLVGCTIRGRELVSRDRVHGLNLGRRACSRGWNLQSAHELFKGRGLDTFSL